MIEIWKFSESLWYTRTHINYMLVMPVYIWIEKDALNLKKWPVVNNCIQWNSLYDCTSCNIFIVVVIMIVDWVSYFDTLLDQTSCSDALNWVSCFDMLTSGSGVTFWYTNSLCVGSMRELLEPVTWLCKYVNHSLW